MKKTTIKILSVLLCVVMCVTMLPMRTEAASPAISEDSLMMYIGNKVTLKVNNTTKTPSWSSSKPSVATVSSKGVVTAKNLGNATISAKIGTKTYKCKVSVVGSPWLDEDTKLLVKGRSGEIQLFGATAKSFTSNKPSVVSVTSVEGNVCTIKAKKKGKAVITCKDKEGHKYQCTVTVCNVVKYTGKVTLPNLGITIKVPEQYNSNGYLYTEIGDNANAFTNAFNNALNGNAQGMAWVGNAYGFYTAGYNSSPNSEITYNGDGTYTLVIGAHFGGGYSSYHGNAETTGFNADAIICELATMSSTPKTVYNKIYDINYGDTMYNADTWYSAGDCKIKYSSKGGFSDDILSLRFTIKKK